MYLDTVEGLYLRATGYYKDIPNGSCKIYHISKLSRLLREGLIRQSKSGLSYRLTDKGYLALENNGYKYERDKFAVGLSDKLYRRLEISEFALMASDIADIFLSKPSDYNNGDIALDVYKRQGRNMSPRSLEHGKTHLRVRLKSTKEWI